MTDFSLKSCLTCEKPTKFKCHCAAWGFPDMYFCSYDCKKDHLLEHPAMNPGVGAKRKNSDNEVTESSKKPAPLKLSDFGGLPKKKSPLLSGPVSGKSVPGHSKSAPDENSSNKKDSSKQDNGPAEIQDNPRRESIEENSEGTPPKGKKPERGPMLIISAMTTKQKTRKMNDLFKMITETLSEMKNMKPVWNFVLKTVSTDENVKIKKGWKFTSQKADVSPNGLSSRLRRRFTKVVQGLRVIEAMRPDLMFEVVTDKPKGTGHKDSHNYQSKSNRPEILAVEDVYDLEDNLETHVEVDKDDDEEQIAVDNIEELKLDCRICKLIIQEDEAALYCGTAKKLDDHYGCHVKCLGFYKVQKDDKFHKDMSVRYRCPEHSD